MVHYLSLADLQPILEQYYRTVKVLGHFFKILRLEFFIFRPAGTLLHIDLFCPTLKILNSEYVQVYLMPQDPRSVFFKFHSNENPTQVGKVGRLQMSSLIEIKFKSFVAGTLHKDVVGSN